MMANDTFLRDWIIDGEQDIDKISRYLNEIKKNFNTHTSFFVSDKSLNYHDENGLIKKVSATDQDDQWYFRVRDMEQDYEINIDADWNNRDVLIIFINYRIYDFTGHYIGVAGVGLRLQDLKSRLDFYQHKYQRSIYFIDQGGQIKLSGDQHNGIRNIAEVDGYQTILDQLMAKPQSSSRFKRGRETIHTNTRYIPEFGWYMIVEQAEGQTTRPIINSLIINLAICGLVTALVLSLVTIVIRSYQKHLHTLQGIVPICSFCKQIRDDQGYWNQVEAYIAEHTDAEFSHGICPECQKKHYAKELDQDLSDDS